MFNIFKKKINQQIEESVNSFEYLWKDNITDIGEIVDKNSFIIAIDGWICKKCNCGENIDKLSAQERIFYIVIQLEESVNNGGFYQYFYNSSGKFANELANSFIEIGAEKTANICQKAVDAFACNMPLNSDKLVDFLDDDEIDAILGECDDTFYDYSDNLEELNYQFVINNKAYFS